MSTPKASALEIYKKNAKQLVRWQREGNYSIGERIRMLPRYRTITDQEALKLKFPLAEAQEIIAVEAGFENWAALKESVNNAPLVRKEGVGPASLKKAIPMLLVSNVRATAEFFRDKLGFNIDFLHGHPPFYGAVSRDAATLHLRFVHEPPFKEGLREREQFLAAVIVLENVKGLYSEFVDAGVEFDSKLTKEPWGGLTFSVLDLDGNAISFCE
jgi:catechol 2,3-dioxygenase-like lactoylglutathione lyase family enzyme